MTEVVFTKERLALVQLERALILYLDVGDCISAITLAGAAEEILGKLVEDAGGLNAYETLVEAASQIHEYLFDESPDRRRYGRRANRARNSLKHLDPGQSKEVRLDPEEEAYDLLDRAIQNYWLLEHSLTPAMERFIRSQHTPTQESE